MSIGDTLALIGATVALVMLWYVLYGRRTRAEVLLGHFPALAAPTSRNISAVLDPLLGGTRWPKSYQARLAKLVEEHTALLPRQRTLAAVRTEASHARRALDEAAYTLAKVERAKWFREKLVAAAKKRLQTAARLYEAAFAALKRESAAVAALRKSIVDIATAAATERKEWTGQLPDGERAPSVMIERNTLLVMFFDSVTPSGIATVLARYSLTVVAGTASLSLFVVRSKAPVPALTAEEEATRLHALATLLREELGVQAATPNVEVTVPTATTTATTSMKDPLDLCFFPAASKFMEGLGAHTPIEVGVLDVGFLPDNEELTVTPLPNTPNLEEVHGSQMGAIIGATRGNSIGIDGAVRHATIIGASPEQCYSFDFNDVLSRILNRTPQLRVVNASVSYNWAENGVIAEDDPEAQLVVEECGTIVRKTVSTAASTILVASAGNDSYPARPAPAVWASPYTWAALGPESAAVGDRAENAIVVEALDQTGKNRLDISNTGGTMKAIGEGVFTITPDLDPTPEDGTSGAAALVTSAIAMMLQVNPKLTVAEVKTHLGVGSGNPTLDALTAVRRAAGK
jgi:hypothetical protein